MRLSQGVYSWRYIVSVVLVCLCTDIGDDVSGTRSQLLATEPRGWLHYCSQALLFSASSPFGQLKPHVFPSFCDIWWGEKMTRGTTSRSQLSVTGDRMQFPLSHSHVHSGIPYPLLPLHESLHTPHITAPQSQTTPSVT